MPALALHVNVYCYKSSLSTYFVSNMCIMFRRCVNKEWYTILRLLLLVAILAQLIYECNKIK